MSVKKEDGRSDAQGSENPKRILQKICECSREIESLTRRCETVVDLFSSELISKRGRLRDFSERLLLLAPKDYGQIAKDKLWRGALYDVFGRVKNLSLGKTLSGIESAYLQSHLVLGVGQLLSILMKFRDREVKDDEEMKTPLTFYIPGDTEVRKGSDAETPQWTKDLVHSLLINIGDLYRYLTDIHLKKGDKDEGESYSFRAQDFYIQAFLLQPTNGLPHNQLGNLLSGTNFGIDAAYYLFYSSSSAVAYEMACGNLRTHLDRAVVDFARRPASVEPKDMEVFANRFLTLLVRFLYEAQGPAMKIELECQELMTNFGIRLSAGEIEGKLLFHITSIAVMLVWRLQDSNSKNVSTVVALTLAIFFQIISQIHFILEKEVKIGVVEEEKEITDELTHNVKDPVEEVKKPRRIRKKTDEKEYFEMVPRQRIVLNRRRKNSESSDNYEDEEEEEDNERRDTEDSGDSVSSSLSEGWSSDEDNSDEEEEDKETTIVEEEIKEVKEDEPKIIKEPKFILDSPEFVKSVEPLLVALVPLMRWIQISEPVQMAFATHAERSLLEGFIKTLNYLAGPKWSRGFSDVRKEIKNSFALLLSKDPSEEITELNYEMAEDRSQLGLEPFQSILKELKREELKENEKVLIRVSRLLKFGFWMSESFPEVPRAAFRLTYSQEFGFDVSGGPNEKIPMKTLGKDQRGEKLAMLYRGRSVNSDQRHFRRVPKRIRSMKIDGDAVTILVDLPAILYHLDVIKCMTDDPHYVILLPTKVWKTIDELKETEEKGHLEARTASRFIDRVLYKSHPGFAIASESLLVPRPKNLVDIPSRDFYETLGYGSWMVEKLKGDRSRPIRERFGDIRDKYRVIYLSGYEQIFAKHQDAFDPIKLAKELGLFVDQAKNYVKKGRFKRRSKRTEKQGHG